MQPYRKSLHFGYVVIQQSAVKHFCFEVKSEEKKLLFVLKNGKNTDSMNGIVLKFSGLSVGHICKIIILNFLRLKL